MTTIATLSVLVDADISRFQRGMNSVNTGVDTAASRLQGLGSSMSSIGQSTAALTVPILAGLGLAVNAATEFDAAMTNVNSILQLGAEDAAALNQEILAIGSGAVAGPQAVAEAYYDIVGGVTDAASRIPILNAAIATSEAGAADLTATTNVLIGAMNAYGASADEATNYSDVLTATVAAGVGSMDSFASAFPAVTGVAASMGIEFSQLGGMMALLTTKGTSAAEASTQLSGAMVSLIRPSENMTAALSAIGYESGQAAVDALGLQGTYQALADAGYTNFADLTNGVEAMRGAIALTSEGATAFLTSFATNIDGATAAARGVQLESASTQFSLLESAVRGLGITLGQSLMLALSNVATWLSPIVQGFTNWITANQQIAGPIVAVVAGVAALGVGMMILGPVVAGVGAFIGLLGSVIAIVVTPLGLMVGAIVGLLAVSGNLPALGEGVQAVVDAVGGLLDGSATPTDWQTLDTALRNLAGLTLQSLADGLIVVIEAVTGQDLTNVSDGFTALGEGLNNAWLALQLVGVRIQTEISNFGLGVQLRVQTFIAELRNTILTASGGTIDIAPNIEMDIAATQASMQANIDAGVAAMEAITAEVTVQTTVDTVIAEGTTVNTDGVAWDAVSALEALTVDSTMQANVTVNGASYDVAGARTAADLALTGTPLDSSLNANVTLSATVDSSGAQATISAAVNSLAITSSGAFGAPAPVAGTTGGGSITYPSAATGADIHSEGLLYVHANEKVLNAADTEAYNQMTEGRFGGGGGGNTYNIAAYGTSPMEVLAMVKRAARSAAPG